MQKKIFCANWTSFGMAMSKMRSINFDLIHMYNFLSHRKMLTYRHFRVLVPRRSLFVHHGDVLSSCQCKRQTLRYSASISRRFEIDSLNKQIAAVHSFTDCRMEKYLTRSRDACQGVSRIKCEIIETSIYTKYRRNTRKRRNFLGVCISSEVLMYHILE